MIRSSSPFDSSPTSLYQSSSVSSRKTYSRRSSALKEKRKAQALAASSDEEGGESLTPSIGDETVGRARELKSTGRNGSPVPKRTRQTGRNEDVAIIRRTSISPSPPPSSTMKGTQGPKSRLETASSRPARGRLSHARTPSVDIHPPSSSPPLPADAPTPSTPPRKSKRLSRPSTPLASPSGYEELFAAVSPRREYSGSPGNPASPGEGARSMPRGGMARPGGLRRMLTKTQSLGVVPSTPSKDDDLDTPEKAQNVSPFGADLSPSQPSTPSRKLLRTQSMPESPSKPDTADGTHPPPQTQAQGSGGRARRTYGRTRTMVVEQSQVDLDSVTLTGKRAVEESGLQQSYAELREKFEVDNTPIERTGSGSGNLMSELLLARAPQTVSDMRSKGENRRFMDELNYLIEGISDSSTGTAFIRASSLDILKNMMDEDWLAKMKICGQVDTVWGCLVSQTHDSSDELMDAICLLFLGILHSSGSGLEHILQSDGGGLIELLVSRLKVNDGPLDDGVKWRSNKAAQKARALSRQLRLEWTCPEPSTRRLSSAILDILCQTKSWTLVRESTDINRFLGKVVSSLKAETRIMADRFDLYEKGLNLLPSENRPDLDHIFYLIDIISHSLANADETRPILIEKQDELLESLVHVMISSSALVLSPEEDVSPNDVPSIVSRNVFKAVELLTSLAQESKENASAIASIAGATTCCIRLVLQSEQVRLGSSSPGEEEAESSLRTEVDEDITVTATSAPSEQTPVYIVLALISHMVLAGEDTKGIVSSITIDKACTGEHACLRRCHCLSAQPTISHLSALYSQYLGRADDDSDVKLLIGHLALLITKLIAAPRSDPIDSLPGETRRDRLAGLLVSLKSLKYEVGHTSQRLSGRDDDETEGEEVGTDHVDEAIAKLEGLVLEMREG